MSFSGKVLGDIEFWTNEFEKIDAKLNKARVELAKVDEALVESTKVDATLLQSVEESRKSLKSVETMLKEIKIWEEALKAKLATPKDSTKTLEEEVECLN